MRKKQKAFTYFDDCKICGAMEKADKRGWDLNLEELRQAFRDQEKKQQKSSKE